MDPTQSRGFLNANPGNMDRESWVWNGEIRDVAQCANDIQIKELTAGRFCVFDSALHGIRAMTKNLEAYHIALGIRTIAGFINEWAPPNENDTAAYIEAVCEHTGFGKDADIDITSRPVMYAIVDAIIRVELGGQPYAPDFINEGLTMAGIA